MIYVFQYTLSISIYDAPLSICRTYRDLLQRFGFLQAWAELPNDPQHAIWKQWEEKVHSRCVVDDHARRMASLSTKPHLSLYMTLKPSDRPCVSHYLQLRGLGPYLKLRLRSNSLPLMDMLQRYCKVPLTDAECECRLCDAGEREDVTHFIAACPSLAPQRAALLERLVADEALGKIVGSATVIRTWRSGDARSKVILLLESFERPLKLPPKRVVTDTELLLVRVEALVLPYLVSIWHRRAQLLGGVPSLDIKGERIVLSQLRADGRCRSFAVGVPSS
jgi:hypothetical protein